MLFVKVKVLGVFTKATVCIKQVKRCLLFYFSYIRIMKKIIFTLIFCITSYACIAQTYPNTRYQTGYTRPSTGSYVQPHYKTQSNQTNHDNFTTRGNTNIYTGSTGSRAKDYSSGAYNYGRGNSIQTGPRGGQYYYNSSGRKTYVPKR